jgi:uncharacterized protein (DUF952 family)
VTKPHTKLYKILAQARWEARGEEVPWAEVDRADGFMHLSTAAQVRETARRHFAGRDDLVLVEIEAGSLPPERLKWEPSRGGDLFPHVYGAVPLAAVTRVEPLVLEDGVHRFPRVEE